MGYLLMATDRRRAARFVAPPGSPKTYVTRGMARVYATRAEAEADRCPENEIIIHQNQET